VNVRLRVACSLVPGVSKAPSTGIFRVQGVGEPVTLIFRKPGAEVQRCGMLGFVVMAAGPVPWCHGAMRCHTECARGNR
jgi:hypothetical protein